MLAFWSARERGVKTVEKEEKETTHMHLLRVRSPTLAGRYHSHLPYMYGAGPGLVTPCHVSICKGGDEGGKGMGW